jgi:hypothetical protein
MLFGTVRAVVLAASTAIITLAQLNKPSKEYWDGRGLLLYLATALFATAVAQELIALGFKSLTAHKVREFERNVRTHLSEALIDLQALYAVAPMTAIGVHAFRIRGLPPFWALSNIGGLRLGDSPYMSRPRWRKGHGVVGRAWKESRVIIEDWADYYKQSNAAGPQSWKKKNCPYGLSWGLLQLTSDYKGIIAVPIYGHKGSVSIDAPLTKAQLEHPKVTSILTTLARRVGDLGSPPAAWWGNRT